jgi:hypothetical protein
VSPLPVTPEESSESKEVIIKISNNLTNSCGETGQGNHHHSLLWKSLAFIFAGLSFLLWISSRLSPMSAEVGKAASEEIEQPENEHESVEDENQDDFGGWESFVTGLSAARDAASLVEVVTKLFSMTK